MSKTLCVFPNDPIIAYYKKGEIKERYYNPENLFDKVHIISFTKHDIDESKVKLLVGNAALKIHSVGKINFLNRSQLVEKILKLVESIKPNVIRAYNPSIEGWFAAKCSKELKIPLFLSLHTQYDNRRNFYKKTNFKKYLSLKYREKFIEPFVLKNADKICIVYRIIEPYVLKHSTKKPELLYNRIDYNRFSNGIPINSLPKPLIITVGNLIKEKNHQCLIKALENIDANLLIIGNGILFDDLKRIITKMKLQNRVIIKKSIPNAEIQNYYKSADVFALAYDPELEGLPIPVIEAMAAGLPIVIPYPKQGFSDSLEDVAVFAERQPSSFKECISKLLKNSDLRKTFSEKSSNKAKQFDNSIIEKREAEIYSELLK